ncbi:PQQ-binding-like beta-propeller repeat protein [Halorarius halobius]|uniref:outer membrane protein assembly factor BamB family protein n=1 Tax=Halorarius halobius TaxID=2962671 RepID=UPI0020CD4536|nr:PQQ-binding-like beta-propeller repeat protein [Halorarius halobius]
MPSRRRLLTAAAALSTTLAGCTDGSTPGTPTGTPPPSETPSAPSATPRAGADPAVRWSRELPHAALTAPRIGVGPDAPEPALYVGRDATDGETADSFPFYALSLQDGSTAWRVDLPNPVQHDPVVKGDRVYVATGRPSKREATDLYALSLADGHVVWSFEGNGPVFPMDATEETVVVGQRDDEVGPRGESLYALAAGDGSQRWRVDSGDAVGARRYRDTLFAETFGGLRALDPATGDQRWQVTADERVDGPAYNRESVFVGTDAVQALALASGDEQWSRSFEFTVSGVTDAPGALGETVYVGDYDGRLLALSPLSGETRWTAEGFRGQFSPTARRFSGDLFVSSRTVARLDPVSGEVRWRYEPDTRGYLGVDPGPETVFVDAPRAGLVAALAFDGTERWTYRPDGYAGSDAAGNTVVVTAGGTVVSLNGKKEA